MNDKIVDVNILLTLTSTSCYHKTGLPCSKILHLLKELYNSRNGGESANPCL